MRGRPTARREDFTQTSKIGKIDAVTAQLQNELWSTVQNVAARQPTPVIALAVSGMNDVLNTQRETQAAWWYAVPLAWVLMTGMAIWCNLLIGYGSHGNSLVLFFVLPLVVSIALFTIASQNCPLPR